MGKLKALQEKYKKGEIKKTEYEAELKKLLEGEFIEQDTYDEALTYDPEADKPIYTQAEVDAIVLKKAIKLARKNLKEAGVEIDADDKSFFSKVVELTKIATGKVKPPEGEGLEQLKKDAEKAKTLQVDLAAVKTENAVLKQVYKYSPYSVSQIVRAINSDYKHYLEIDDVTGEVDLKSIDRAIKTVQKEEPNLFKADDEGGKGKGGQDEGNNFYGKGPGGGTGGNNDYKAKKAEVLGLIDAIPKKNQ